MEVDVLSNDVEQKKKEQPVSDQVSESRSMMQRDEES